MGKYSFENNQYVVYARNQQEAKQVISEELKRFDQIKSQMANLLTENGEEWQKFMDNISEDRLNIYFNDQQSAIYDRDLTAKGEVRQRNIINGEFSYDLAYRYPEIAGHNADFRLAHEMGHLMLNPSRVNQQKYDAVSNSTQVAGIIRRDETTGKFYGQEIQENAINLIAQLAIRGNIKADDIIKGQVDLSEYNSYKNCDELVKLLAVSMRNDFENEMTFEQLVNNKIDSMIINKDGKEEPANTFFYGIVNDSSIIENEFDKYLGKGAWKELNEAFTKLYDQNLSKEKIELIFKNAQELIQEFASVRYQDKYNQLGILKNDIDIQNKSNIINEIVKSNNEIIKNKEEQEEITPIETENKLSLMQKVAHFLQKHNIFMNLSFVDKFVHQQLDVLPVPKQEIKNINTQSTNKTKENFINGLTDFGKYRNLPPIERMSDPEKIEEMKRKMQQNQKINQDYERE